MKTLLLIGLLAATALPDSLRAQVYPEPIHPIADADSLPQAKQAKAARLWAVGSSSLLTLGATYVYLERTWWNGRGIPFHVDGGRDRTYASGLDKVAHFAGGVFISDTYYNAFRWAGMTQHKAAWLALGSAAFVQWSIELKDAYSPTYGFSWRDVAAGTIGGFWPMVRNQSRFLNDAQWKAGYWQRTPKYFMERGIPVQRLSIDDYLNQTYWLSFSPEHFGSTRWQRAWPDWLQISVGMGLEAETWSLQHDGLGGRHEWYLAPDVNLVKLFKPRSAAAKLVVGLLKYVKIPAPTLQIGPKVRWHWLFF
ncbi:DUF2279 domain-containing protein [Spirosoma utsteinense]|uniref:DUF2279 domain-containing protein n=1 Tax=Spirosoma utsteinense TaxID=2585773 RepID=A0ABR6W3U8_9BACT|nr:DUF2279 domain-containing protein [Spirosoma utsteinense]MBC3788027.1 hypothetical protein [Spirosoma utsteinense]MBC3791271.1 hypothetical protein [Spirosoma utsteinense]